MCLEGFSGCLCLRSYCLSLTRRTCKHDVASIPELKVTKTLMAQTELFKNSVVISIS